MLCINLQGGLRSNLTLKVQPPPNERRSRRSISAKGTEVSPSLFSSLWNRLSSGHIATSASTLLPASLEVGAAMHRTVGSPYLTFEA